MKILPVRNTPEKELPWAKNSIYRYSSQNRYPNIIIRLDGKLFIDLDAFHELMAKTKKEQIKKAERMRRGIGQ